MQNRIDADNRNLERAGQSDLIQIFRAALAAADPYDAVTQAVGIEQGRLSVAGMTYDLAAFERIIVVGAGKATARMALAIEALLGPDITAGLVIVKRGHTAPMTRIVQAEAAHPLPDQAGVEATQRLLQMVQAADEKTLVICLLSGGASALLVAPAPGVTLLDQQETTRLLMNAGASITELNGVRKHLSRVKGGMLAQAMNPATVLTLLLSDVIGDSLSVIASGPTAPDESSFASAWEVISKYGLRDALPRSVIDYMQRGLAGQAAETVKPNDPSLAHVHNVIIAGNRQALQAAAEAAGRLGYSARLVSDALQGEARDAARYLVKVARAELAGMQPGERRCLLSGGETTVTVVGNGMGGRNQELALAFALEIAGEPGIELVSSGTDGSDGPTDALGAMVDGDTIVRARALGMEPLRYLDRNDSFAFFQKLDTATGSHCHLRTGPTGTNVMDIQVILLHK